MPLSAIWRADTLDREPELVERRLGLPASDLAAGGAQHVLAELDDQAGVLGHRDELGRRHRAALGVVPAQQRLDARDLAAGQVVEGLVGEPQLVGALERAAQVGLDLQSRGHPRAQPGVEHLVAAAPALLGAVQRGDAVQRRVQGRGRPGRRGRHTRAIGVRGAILKGVRHYHGR
jgi:hypothetical protein